MLNPEVIPWPQLLECPVRLDCAYDGRQRWQRGKGELLLHRGADINVRDPFDYTALKIAQRQGHKEIVELLKAHGAKE